MNSSDRILNNLKVLQDHGVMIEEERDFATCCSTYKFEINDVQLSHLNIKHYDEREEMYNMNCCCTMDDHNDKYAKLFDKIVKKHEAVDKRPSVYEAIRELYADNKKHILKGVNCMTSFDITKVEVLNNRVVIMRFGDGSFTKAVCTEDDAKNGKFDVDIGITICLIKKMLGETEDNKKGYAKLLRGIHKMMDEQAKEAKEEEERKLNAKARKARKAQRRAASVQQENDMFRNDISDAVFYALARLEEQKSESEKVD